MNGEVTVGNTAAVAPQPCICFVHQGKTAGISIIQSLAELFEPHEVSGYAASLPQNLNGLRLLGGHFRFADFEKIQGEKLLLTSMRRPTPRLISLYRYWKSFKNSHAIAIGSWNIIKAQQLSFTELLRTTDGDLFLQIDNPAVRQLCGPTTFVEDAHLEEACSNLEKCEFIFLTERLSDDYEEFSRYFDLKIRKKPLHINATDNNHNTNPLEFNEAEAFTPDFNDKELLQLLEERTKYDVALYNFACDLKERRRVEKRRGIPLKVKYPRIVQGELITGASEIFQKILGTGWTSSQAEDLWSYGDRATLRFTVDYHFISSFVLRLEISPCMLPQRHRIDLVISITGGHRIKTSFFQNGAQIHARNIAADTDFLCFGNQPFVFDLPLSQSTSVDQGYDVTFELGPLQSPAALGYNDDDRMLGVKILSLQVISQNEAGR